MKKTIAILLAMLLGLSLFAGCGKEKAEPEDETGFVELEFVKYKPMGGWYLRYEDDDEPYELVTDDPEDGYITFRSSDWSPNETLEDMKETYPDGVQKANVKINGIEYLVWDNNNDEWGNDTIVLIASLGSKLKADDDGNLEIDISYATLEQAMPVLETVKLK